MILPEDISINEASQWRHMIDDSRQPPEPFPWLCPRCGREDVQPATITYKTTKTFEGREYEVEAPNVVVFECRDCGEQLFNHDAGDQIQRAFRATLGLLQPEAIREGRRALGLSLEEFAAKLRFAEDSVARWETGVLVQSRHADTLVRVYFASPSLRRTLDAIGASADFGESVRYEEPAINAG